jgi:hypothetical protein
MPEPEHSWHERHDSASCNNNYEDIADASICNNSPGIITARTAPDLPSTDIISRMEELTLYCERVIQELKAEASETRYLSRSPDTTSVASLPSTSPATTVEPLTRAEISSVTHPEFDLWCKQNNTDPMSFDAFDDFLIQAKLIPSPEDPPDYPGYTHAVCIHTNAGEFTLSTFIEESIKQLILQNLGLLFEVGTTIDKRWKITEKLVGVEGCYNQGIFLVHEKDKSDDVRIMKLLPTHATYPNYAAREIDILRRLSHPNIITFLDGKTSPDPTGPNYLVTNYCNLGTLSDLLKHFYEIGILVPELFLWHISNL